MCLVETKGLIGIRYTLSATTVLATQQRRQGSQMVHHIHHHTGLSTNDGLENCYTYTLCRWLRLLWN